MGLYIILCIMPRYICIIHYSVDGVEIYTY